MQVVATLGPASSSREVQRALADVVDRFRLNASHLDPPGLERWLGSLDELYRELGRELPVVVDLQGAKMRVGALDETVALVTDQHLRFVRDASGATSIDAIPAPHPQLYEAVSAGERLWLDDARLEVEVEDVDPGAGVIDARVLRGGTLRPHKGLNRPDHPIPCPHLLERDESMLSVALAFPFSELAFSFVHDGQEATLLAKAREAGRRLIAKIERVEAFQHLSTIAAHFDELWLCRGDLGSQAGIFALGDLQRRFSEAHERDFSATPTLLAGQVLEHLTAHSEPTRAEVVQLARLAEEGFGGLVLSDETAIGREIDALVAFLRAWRSSPRELR